MRRPAPRIRRRVAAAALAVAAVVTLAGCAPTVSLTPAQNATAVACARIVVGLPQTIGAFARRQVDAQGTAAWGEPVQVTMWCGVPQPGPTTDQCTTIDKVDWLVHVLGKNRYLVTTYGRSPAVQVELGSGVASSDALPPISDAVSAAGNATVRCTTGTATPAPGASASASASTSPTP